MQSEDADAGYTIGDLLKDRDTTKKPS